MNITGISDILIVIGVLLAILVYLQYGRRE